MLYNARLHEEICANASNSADSGTRGSEDADPDLTPRRSWTGGILHDLVSLIAFLALLLMPTGTVKVNRLPLRQYVRFGTFKRHFKTTDAQRKVEAPRDENTGRARVSAAE